MKEDRDIDTMYSRFQTLVSCHQVLKKSYYVLDHVKKIIRSLPARFRPKGTTIQEAKDLDKLRFESLIRSLKSREIEFVGDEPVKKSMSIALISKGKSAKALQAIESEEETLDGDSEIDSNVQEMAYLTKRLS